MAFAHSLGRTTQAGAAPEVRRIASSWGTLAPMAGRLAAVEYRHCRRRRVSQGAIAMAPPPMLWLGHPAIADSTDLVTAAAARLSEQPGHSDRPRPPFGSCRRELVDKSRTPRPPAPCESNTKVPKFDRNNTSCRSDTGRWLGGPWEETSGDHCITQMHWSSGESPFSTSKGQEGGEAGVRTATNIPEMPCFYYKRAWEGGMRGDIYH